MHSPALVDSPDAPLPRPLLFLVGVLGLPAAVVLAAIAEAALRIAGVEGEVSSGFFIVVAAVAPILAIGLLVQLVTTLAGSAQGILLEIKRFEEEMAAEGDEPDLDAHRSRVRTWEGVRVFLEVLRPFGVGLLLQFLVLEIAAIVCIAAGVEARGVAIALGAQVVALVAYLVLFRPVVAVLARMRTSRAR